MLALLLGLLFSSGIHAQNFYYTHNSAYGNFGGMNQYRVADGETYTSGTTNTDPTADLTMDCLAANGYGQWTVSTAVGSRLAVSGHPWIFSPDQGYPGWSITQGWFLLGNSLTKPSEKYVSSDPTHPGCQPPGIVSGGNFQSVTIPIATRQASANLEGRVRFVGRNGAGTSFTLEGLNDERGATLSDQQIDITLNGFPNPSGNTQIVKRVITAKVASTFDGTIYHPVVSSAIEPDSRDQFRIACDQDFEYITWCSPNAGTGKLEIWVTVSNLATGTTLTGFPLQVAAAAGQDFKRPTVACDVRHTSSTTPQFDVAYINNGQVTIKMYSGTTVALSEVLPLQFTDPISGTTNSITTPITHACVLVSSINGSSALTHCVYVIDGDDILLYKPITWGTDIATYVDGKHANLGGTNFPYPIPTSSLVTGIVDKPIIAFANPYDNQTGTYNEFHCMYQLAITPLVGSAQKPLVLVQSNNSGFAHPSTPNTRILLNQDNPSGSSPRILDDPDHYVGAVNQMGIHIHWRTPSSATLNPSTHFYVRDERRFDEPIEEHTLVTNHCRISDGTSHGGTNGAQLLDGAKLTVWTDPNYGASTTDPNSGLYGNTPISISADLVFLGTSNIGQIEGSVLTVGDHAGVTSAHVYTLPLCLITSEFDIEPNSIWDYYGSPNATSTPPIVLLDGSSSLTYPNLLIHGGARFTNCAFFTSNYGKIDLLYEPNILPQLLSTSTNVSATGFFQAQYSTTLNNSRVNSYLPTADIEEVLEIDGSVGHASDATTDYTSSSTDYTNYGGPLGTIGGGVGILQYNFYGNACKSPNNVIFNGGTITRERIHVIDPKANFTLENMTFDQFSDKEVYIERHDCTDALGDTYDNIIVASNTFFHYAGIGAPTNWADQFGIYIKNFNLAADFGKVNVTDNIFTTDNSTSTPYAQMNSAICFENTTGNIRSNTITDPGWVRGIWLQSTGTTPPMTHAYLCSNDIENLMGYRFGQDDAVSGCAILSDHFDGIVQLNHIKNCWIGYWSGLLDKPHLCFSTVESCGSSGIVSQNFNSEVFLTGIHSATSGGDNIAGLNIIRNNVVDQVSLAESNSIIHFGKPSPSLWWTIWGQNNTYAGTGSTLLVDMSELNSSDIGSVDGNNWDNVGTGINPNGTTNGHWNSSISSQVNCADGSGSLGTITYNSSSPNTGGPFSFSGITCDHAWEKVKSKGIQTMSVVGQASDTCADLINWVYADVQPQDGPLLYQMQYDSIRLYVERCGAKDYNCYVVFNTLNDDVQEYSTDTNRYNLYRDWLLSVLYVNTINPAYYCNDLLAVANTFSYGKYALPNAWFAVMKFVLSQPHCSDSVLRDYYKRQLDARHTTWLEGDTTKPEDTTLPSLDQLGLGFLLKGSVGQASPSLSPVYLASFTSSPNPFKQETTLEFTLNRMAYTTVAVYDELGRWVWGDTHGSSLDDGDHTVHIDGSKLPSGTLYARISTGFGEVKTVKLVHEK